MDERAAEDRVRPDRPVVLQPDELHRRHAIPIEERQVNGVQEGREHEQAIDDDRGKDVQVADATRLTWCTATGGRVVDAPSDCLDPGGEGGHLRGCLPLSGEGPVIRLQSLDKLLRRDLAGHQRRR